MGRLVDLVKSRPTLLPRGPIREALLSLLEALASKLPSLGTRSAHNAEEWSIHYDAEGNIAKILVNRAVESR